MSTVKDQEKVSATPERKSCLPSELENTANQPSGKLLAAVSISMFLASLILGRIITLMDDPFYLHSWWMYSQGYVAHRDFFDFGFPGLWLLLAPLAWLPWAPSSWVLFGRSVIAVVYGCCIWLVGRLVRAWRWEGLVLGAVGLWILIDSEFCTFRRVYFESALCLGHLVLLERIATTHRPGWVSAWAALAIGTTCVISQRGFFYLPIQPIGMTWILWGQWKKLRQAFIGWVLGGLAAALPTIAYLTYHHLWKEQWQWAVVFPSQVVLYIDPILRPLIGYGLLLAIGIGGLWLDRHIPSQTKKFLSLASLFIFISVMCTYSGYTKGILLILIGGLWISVLRILLQQLGLAPTKEAKFGIGLAVLSLLGSFALDMVRSRYPCTTWLQQARILNRQLQVLDWLGKVCEGEPTASLEPYHPMLCPDATFLRGGWPYISWHAHPLYRGKLSRFGQELLETRPPVISANHVPAHTQGRDLVDWFRYRGLISPLEAKQLRQMLRDHYVEVTFPEIRYGIYPGYDFCLGDTFWVRRDRFEACPLPPMLHLVRAPDETSLSARKQWLPPPRPPGRP